MLDVNGDVLANAVYSNSIGVLADWYYSGQIVKWDDLVKHGTSEFPQRLAWDAPAPVQKDADGNYPIPVPGKFKPW